MGNCLAININIPCDQLFTACGTGEAGVRTLVELQNDLTRLKAARDDIARTIEESPDMRPLEIVNQWLHRVAVLEDQVNMLITNRAQESSNICFCPRNCKKIFTSWKKIHQLDQEVLHLQSQVPDVIVERPRVAPTLQVPTEPTTGMQLMLDEVWSCVENGQGRDHVGLVGLYGMGGVGKTTLLKAVNNKLCCSSTLNFDLQLWIVVSKAPNLSNIQNYIGKKIGFHGDEWRNKSQEEKAIGIYNVLCEKKYILLLDDLWERFDLVKVGIPIPNSTTNKSMVIFTTRSLQVCGQMEATPIHIGCLNDEEAWNLFKKSVGEKTLNDHGDIDALARGVMRECKGLPLALHVIGRAMTLKTTTDDWKHAINVLQGYGADFSTITEEVFIPLKYSYDSLTNDALRSCLLYCSLYAEDQEISKRDLVDKWICEGFLGRFHDLEKDRNEGFSYISILMHASLLEMCSLETVKMHDVIRDIAIWIAGDDFYVKARAGLSEIPEDLKWGHIEKLSLMDNCIGELNGPTEVTNVNTILAYHGGFSFISNDFCKFVPRLKVLDLSYNRELTSLPEEFCELVYLRYLNLSRTKLKELPNGFRKLVKLKYLNVWKTEIITIPEGVLSSMKELCVFRCGKDRDTTFYDFLGDNLSKEFEGLKYLQDVEIPATSRAEITNLASSINLLNGITMLTITNLRDSTTLDISFLKEMKLLRFLSIENLENLEKMVFGRGQGLETSTINQDCFNTSLRELEIAFCRRLKNLSWLVFFPNIEYIDLRQCAELQTLASENEYEIDDEVQRFAKLRTLHLMGLPKLESIHSTCLPFPHLSRLFVNDGCDNLKSLPFDSRSCDQARGIKIHGYNNWWNELQWKDEATRSTFSLCFKSW